MPPVPNPTSKVKNAYPYDANFYDFAVEMWKASQVNSSYADLFVSDQAYDAMSISVSQEKYRKLKVDPSDPSKVDASVFKKFSNSSWYNAFNKLCGTRCNMLTFELVDSSKKPTVNQFLYRLNQSASFNNTLEKPEAFTSLRLKSPAQLTEIYYECTPTTLSAFNQATGLATSNADLLTRLMWIVAVNILVCFILFYDKEKVFSPTQLAENESKAHEEKEKIARDTTKLFAECLLNLTTHDQAKRLSLEAVLKNLQDSEVPPDKSDNPLHGASKNVEMRDVKNLV